MQESINKTQHQDHSLINDSKITGPHIEGQDDILTKEALNFVCHLEKEFGGRISEMLSKREERQSALNETATLSFPKETEDTVRQSEWSVKPAPHDLQDRRVEITGPVERKMIINALNSGANAFMADFEDSNTPTWDNQINGQINLRDANLGTIYFKNDKGKEYKLRENPAVLIVRPRGLHMQEKHMLFNDKPVAASLFDFGLYLFHNAHTLISKNSGPYFYIPKLEHYLEARLWNDIFCFAEDYLDLERSTVRATILIETITAAFQMDEILFELKDHIVGLNCGRWDYIFSFIKKFAKHPEYVLPDRDDVGMTRHFLNSYSLLLIKTCHKRGAHAMGGMAAQIPIKNDDDANKVALDKFIADKQREAQNGHDGTWVAHPGLVQKGIEIFNAVMPEPNQIEKQLDNITISEQDLLKVPEGQITEAGLRKNINVGLLYLKAWLSGNGCVPIYNLMEDAATAEISRTQLWQWRYHKASLNDGRTIDESLLLTFFNEEANKLKEQFGKEDVFLSDAIKLFEKLIMDSSLEEFLTTDAYELVIGYENS